MRTLAYVLAASIVLTSAAMTAGAEKEAAAKKPDPKGMQKRPAEETARANAAAFLARYGKEAKDPEALVVAARLLGEVNMPVATDDLQLSAKKKVEFAAEKPKSLSAADLLSQAREFAGSDNARLGVIAETEKKVAASSKHPAEQAICYYGWCYGQWGCWFWCY